MLDIVFYSQDKTPFDSVDITQDLYEWLEQSDFSKIAKSKEIRIKAAGELIEISAITLKVTTRKNLSNFFRDAIVEESDKLFLPQSDSEYKDTIYNLEKLQALRKLVENKRCKYLEF